MFIFQAMEHGTYTLRELAEITGIEARTIRSYIAKGLLAGPLSHGRNARYSERHLERLREIQLLKDRGMTLEEIRNEHLHARSSLHRLFSQAHSASLRSSPPPSFQQAAGPTREMDEMEGPDAPLLRLLRILQNAAGHRRAHRRSRTELWTQVEVTPEIQLHVRGELSEEERGLVRQIADHMRDILLG